MQIREISYADLARAAKEIGNSESFWRAFEQHRRVHRKLWAQRKALTVCDTVKGV